MNLKFCLILLLFVIGSEALNARPKSSVLIYTKNGEGYVHDNITASVAALQAICEKHQIETVVRNTPEIFTDEQLQQFAAIVFSNSNNEAFDTDAQRLALMHYVEAGGGFMGIHCACASERRWPWFWSMVGGAFVRHPELQPFDIFVVDHNHPSTEFLGQTWHWEDECYLTNNLNPDIHILLAVDLRTVTDDQLDKFPGKVFGNYYPLAWYHEFDGGRQFYTALGHKIEYYQIPEFVKHLEGGLLWTIGKNKPLDYSKATAVKIELLEKPYGQD
jgi:uncharacterized protein